MLQLFSILGTLIFQFLSGPPGTGKTQILINLAISLAKNHQKVCFSLPGIDTIIEVFDRICAKAIGIKVTMIHSKNCENVTQTLLHHLKNCNPDEGEILIITHTTLQSLQFWPNKKNWKCFLDEVTTFTKHYEITLQKHSYRIKDYCQIDFSEKYSLISAKNTEELKQNIKNKTDDKVFHYLKPFYKDLLNSTSGKTFCIGQNQFNENFFNDNSKKFVSTSFYSPKFLEGFDDVIISSADFETTLLFHGWQKIYGVTFIPSELTSQLRDVPRKAKIVVHYMSDKRWTQYLKGKTINDTSTSDHFYSLVKPKIGNEPVLVLKNLNDKVTFPNMTLCPYFNQGLNKYDHHTNFVFSGAFNNEPSYYCLMEHFNLAKEAEKSLMADVFFQGAYRTAIRRIDFEGTANFFIPSLSIFEQVEHMFEGYEVVKICLDDEFDSKFQEQNVKNGRPVKENSINSNEQLKALRTLSYRMLKKTKLIDDDSQSIRWTLFDKPQLKDDGNYSWPKIGSDLPLTADKFFTAMKNEALETLVSNKMDQFLVSLAKFSQGRKREDIELVYGQFLDFDSELYPFTCEMFQSLFPDVKCLSFPTFSGGNRRRLVFLFDKPLAVDDAQKVYNEVFDKIMKKYPDCKLDPKSKELQQLYFMPCKTDQMIDYRDGNLFDTAKCLALSCQWPLSEEQIKQNKKQEVVKEVKVYDNDYSKIITPFIQKMERGNFYVLGKKAVGHCKTKFPSMKDRLFEDMRIAGMSKAHLDDLNDLWFK